ncbi:unnamed protein product [Symbiodinium sp. CCMP2592]|nr:unnamed protein product [Symbiodinium sp. CCMP2592]
MTAVNAPIFYKRGRVKLRGLVSQPSLNGWFATVLADCREGRCQVQLDGHEKKAGKRIDPSNLVRLHEEMPSAAFIDIPQACIGRVDGNTGSFGVHGLTTSNIGQCAICVILGSSRGSLTHVDNAIDLSFFQTEAEWDLSVELLAGGPAAGPKIALNLKPDFIKQHPVAVAITSATKACDHVKLLGLGLPEARLVFDCWHWCQVDTKGILPEKVRNFINRLPIASGLRPFLEALRQEFAQHLKQPVIWNNLQRLMGMPADAVLKIQLGSGRDHDRCLFLANVLRLRDDSEGLHQFVVNSIVRCVKDVSTGSSEVLIGRLQDSAKDCTTEEFIFEAI